MSCVKRQKNDAADAEAICEAVQRPSMRFVPVKTPDQQACLMLHRTRHLFIRQQTAVINSIRAHLAEFGIVSAVGRGGVKELLEIAADPDEARIPDFARQCVLALGDQLQQLRMQILEFDRRINAWHRSNELSRRLDELPGVGPALATALVASVPDAKVFKSGRDFSAWIGLVPKQSSSGGKERLGSITKQGDRYLRSLFTTGALAVIQFVKTVPLAPVATAAQNVSIRIIAWGHVLRASLVWPVSFFLAAWILVQAVPTAAQAQSERDIKALSQQAVQLYAQGKYSEATVLAEQTLQRAELVLGREHLDTVESAYNLGTLYLAQGRYGEAEPLLRGTLEAFERALGPEAPETLANINNLAAAYDSQRRFGESEPLHLRALEAKERVLGREHPETLATLSNLGMRYYFLGQYREAEPLFRRVLETRERILGREHLDTVKSVYNLGGMYLAQGRYGEAEPLLMRALEAFERVFGPEARETLANVSNLAELYHNQGRYDESERLQRRALEVNERILGRDHPETLTSLNNIAGLYQTLGRYDDAEPLYRRVIEASDRVRGKDHPDTLTALNNLASLYEAQGRYSEAELLSRRVLETGERALGVEHPDTLRNLNNLAALLDARGRSSEAEALYRRALEASERVLGREHPHTLSSVDNLALLYQTMGRYSDAERLFGRALEASERVLGREHPDTLRCLSNLALLYEAQGNYDQAETIFLQVLTAMERVLGREHPATLLSVNNLAALYEIGGRYAEAEPLYLRALEAEERVLGRTHPQTLASINNLAFLYQVQGRYIDAEPLHHRALEDNERLLGREHPNTLMSVNSLAGLYQAAGRHNEAEPLYRRALEVSERVRGKEHPDTLTTMNNLGTLYQVQGRYSEAEPLLHRALEAKERVLGSEHPDVLSTVNNLALLHSAQGDWLRATQYWQRSTAVIAARTRRGALNPQQPRGAKKSEVDRSSWQFRQLVKAMHQLVRRSDDPGDVTASAAFMTAQWALGSEAAQSMKQMAARSAKGDPALAALARERQDKLGEWQALDVWRSAMLGKGASKRDTKAEAEVSAKLAALDRRIEEIDALFTAKFPDYFAVINPEPVSVKDVQAQLGADEALVLFLDTVNLLDVPEETFVWVVTRTQMRWVRSELGTVALAREVDALRCGLDTAAWSQPSDCPQLTGQSRAGERLPFDQARAHRLYTTLFGGAEDIIRGKHLLIVPSGALTQLPFAVLVTAPPQGRDHRLAAWLVRDHAITVLPAVSSLKALRVTGHTSAATKPLTGFGNPLLDGADSRSKSAALARQTQSCPKSLLRQAVEFLGVRRGTAPVRMRNGLAEPADLRRLEPLPETADELCAVARAFGAEDSDIHLGIRASEREVKEMSQRGELAQYRIVHFATHGAMAGELKSSNEPGLVLTPPEQASETDDGYLTASEITGLKLDADWVILSACNTAAGQATSAEALSGLARAFIYAQARALLVSHWAVDSNATVKLITFAMREMPRDKTVGRAEALRRAMLALIDKGEAHEAHPAYWAPFIVVGEGAS